MTARTYEHRSYIVPRLGESNEHARKRVFKGITGCKPASKAERRARQIGKAWSQSWT